MLMFSQALGVTKFTNMRETILVTLCCATYVRFKCLTVGGGFVEHLSLT